MSSVSRVRRHLCVLAVAMAVAVVPQPVVASTDNTASSTPEGVTILELPDHEDHQGFVPKTDRPPVLAEPVAVVATTRLAPWTLAFIPMLGAAAGALAGLQRRWSRP